MLVFDTKDIADSAAVETVRTVNQVGQQQFDTFAKESILERTKTLDEAIRRNKLPLFDTITTNQGKATPLSRRWSSFLDCTSAVSHEMATWKSSSDMKIKPAHLHFLSQGNSTQEQRVTCCSAWLDMLKLTQSEALEVTVVFLDGATITQMLKPGTAKTFEEYAHQIFIPYIARQLRNPRHLDLVWDTYKDDSIKASTREKRGKRVRRRVVKSAAIPGN